MYTCVCGCYIYVRISLMVTCTFCCALQFLNVHELIFIIQVAKRAIQLSSLCLDVRGVGNLNVQQIKQDTTYTLLMSSFPTSIYVYPATSVTGSLNRELISVGDSVHFSTGPNEVSIIMASCCLVY